MEACRSARTTVPLIRCVPNDLWMAFAFAADYLLALEGHGEGRRQGGGALKTPVETPEQILRSLGENFSLILAEVSEKTGKALRAVERASAELVKIGQLKYIGPQKGGRWEITPKQ